MLQRIAWTAALAAVAWIGVAGAADAQPVTLSYWNFFTGGAGGRMNELVQDFNKSQSQVKIARLGTAILHQAPHSDPLRQRARCVLIPSLAHAGLGA
jgi:hypothetical protein